MKRSEDTVWIRKIKKGIYSVNKKIVNTKEPQWGKNISAHEKEELKKFRDRGDMMEVIDAVISEKREL